MSANKEYSFLLEFIHIFKLGALDSAYTRIHALFELTWLFFYWQLCKIVHKFGGHPVKRS